MEIFKLFGSIFVDSSEADASLAKTEEKAGGVGERFAKVGGVAAKAGGVIAAGVGVAATAVTGLMVKTMETANEINKFSQVTGMSKAGFQEWDYVAKSVGFSMEAASGDMAALAEKAMDAQSGVGENAEIFKELGINVEDASGKLKTQEQLFDETISGLQGMEDVTRRNAIATAFLSTTGEELAPILNMTSEELANMKKNANVISDDDLAKAEEFNQKWNAAKATFGGVVSALGFQLMPIFDKLLGWVTSNMPTIQNVIDGVFSFIGGVITGATNIFKEHLLPILTQLWEQIKTNLLPIFTNWIDIIQGNLPLIKDIFSAVFSAIVAVLSTVWAFLRDNILPIFMSLFTWVQSHMPTIRETARAVFEKIVEVAKKVWAFFVENLLPIINRFAAMIRDNMPTIQRIVEKAFSIIVSVVRTVWDIFENVLLPVLRALWDWISPNIPKIQSIVEAAFEAIFATVDVVVGVFEDLTKGIQKAIDWLTFWDDKKVSPKKITVTEERTTSTRRTQHATGTNYFEGGSTLVGERGAEMISLPRGSKILPANATRNALDDLGSRGNVIIEVPVILEGREVARGTYRYISELSAADTRNNMRARGISV